MRILEQYSHLNGVEFLMVHHNDLWIEIKEVISGVDAERCKTKISEEKRTEGRVFYSPVDMNSEMKGRFEERKWESRRTAYWITDDAQLIRRTMVLSPNEQKQVIEDSGRSPIYSYNQTDFMKNRVAVEVQFGKYSFVAYDLFVKHMAFFVGDFIDVGGEILPMKRLQIEMSSGVPYYEGALYDLLRQGRGIPAVPLVLVGVAP